VNSKQRSATKRTYIDPFMSLKRNLVFLGTFLGMYGFALVNTVSSYDLASAGAVPFLSFAALAYIPAGFIYWPLLYMAFSAIDGLKWRAGLMLIQLVSLVVYTQTPPEATFQGIVSGIMMAPFWCVHHVAMVQNTTTENRGYEVSLGMFIALGSSFLSATTSGYYLETGHQSIAIIIALSTMMAGTFCFLLSMAIVRQHTVKHFIKECKRVIHENPYMIRRIVSHSLFDIPTLAIGSIMHLVGISPTIMATILIARLILMSFLSPVIGTVSHKYRKHGYALGLALFGSAWLLLATAPENPLLFFAFMILFSFGNRLADGSLVTGLYEMQSYASMMWSEVYMSIGRVLSLLFLLPLLFYNVRIYLFALAALSAIIYVINRKWQRRWADAEAM